MQMKREKTCAMARQRKVQPWDNSKSCSSYSNPLIWALADRRICGKGLASMSRDALGHRTLLQICPCSSLTSQQPRKTPWKEMLDLVRKAGSVDAIVLTDDSDLPASVMRR